jgi:Na+-transporting NADH:ubiquinone oxidoreductase subunit C
MKLDTKKPLYVLVYVVLISAVFTAAIVAVQIATAGRVERNERMRRYRAIVKLFAARWSIADPADLSEDRIIELYEKRIDATARLVDRTQKPPLDLRLYRAYASERKADLVGVAFRVGGNGFWAPIKGYMAVDPKYQHALGIVFVEQKETPGLGGRITEPLFTDQFSATVRKQKDKVPLAVTLPRKGAERSKVIYIGRGQSAGPQDPRHGRSVDAITGATQTSLAVERFLNEDLRRLQKALEDGRVVEKTSAR